MSQDIRTYLQTVQQAMSQIDATRIECAVEILFDAFIHGRSVYTMGNGASAALAAHMACDLGKGTATDIGLGPHAPASRRLRITSLVDNIALMTAYGNDVCYEDVFVEQIKGLLVPGDVVIAISGSGSSPNVVRALEFAKRHGAATIGLTGARPSAALFNALCDVSIQAPLIMMEQIEDLHVMFSHAIAVSLREHIASYNSSVASIDGLANVPLGATPLDLPANP